MPHITPLKALVQLCKLCVRVCCVFRSVRDLFGIAGTLAGVVYYVAAHDSARLRHRNAGAVLQRSKLVALRCGTPSSRSLEVKISPIDVKDSDISGGHAPDGRTPGGTTSTQAPTECVAPSGTGSVPRRFSNGDGTEVSYIVRGPAGICAGRND